VEGRRRLLEMGEASSIQGAAAVHGFKSVLRGLISKLDIVNDAQNCLGLAVLGPERGIILVGCRYN